MKSHEYQLRLRDWAGAIFPTLFVLACLGAALEGGTLLKLFPPPRAASDPTTAVLAHQARAARSRQPGQIVLAGDSTCMVDVDAPGLSRQLPGRPAVMNLALLIWLDLSTYGQVLEDFVQANPGQVRVVVLLVTPRKLSLGRDQNEEEFWRQIRSEVLRAPEPAFGRHPVDWLGLEVLRHNLLSQVMVAPLRGQGPGTAFFGFASEIDAYMTAHQGSLLEFGNVSPPRATPRSPAPALAAGLETESRSFRATLPPGAKLVIGLTPVAESHSSPAQHRERNALLDQWNQWIGADLVLNNLPTTLPDVFFASEGHLNQVGQKRFTRLLAAQLATLVKTVE